MKMAPRPRTRTNLGPKSKNARRAKEKLRRETPEQREHRLRQARESQKRRRQNETLLEREERLAVARSRYARLKPRGTKGTKGTPASRETQLKRNRLQAARRAAITERKKRLMQTLCVTFAKTTESQIQGQLHQTKPKALRLSATNVMHIDIASNTYNKGFQETTFNGESSKYLYPKENIPIPHCGNLTLFEPKVVISEPDYLPAMVAIKGESMSSEPEDAEVITGDINPNPEPMISETELGTRSQYMEVITGNMNPNPEVMISETELGARSQLMDTETSASIKIKSEINIKSEVYTIEL